ncbi:MAG: CHAD domain-containing protein [Candidatus Acidiferrales bacterium]
MIVEAFVARNAGDTLGSNGRRRVDMALNHDRIQKNIQKLRKLLKKPSKLRNPKGVHDLRTRARRIEAMLPATGLAKKRQERKLLRQLRPIRKRAGKVRDMDVLTAHLLELDPDGESDCEVQLLEYLGAERFRLGKKLRRLVKRSAGSARGRLKRVSKELESIAGTSNGNASASDESPRMEAAASALALASALSEPRALNRNNLHPYRLKVKELRYVLKSAGGDANRSFIAALGNCKDAIGEWHDWEQLLGIARDLLEHGKNCKLLDHLNHVTRQKFEKALSVTNQTRKDLVGARNRHNQRSSGKHLKQPALRAAGAIAR